VPDAKEDRTSEPRKESNVNVDYPPGGMWMCSTRTVLVLYLGTCYLVVEFYGRTYYSYTRTVQKLYNFYACISFLL